jgi:hypothetical protein
MLDAAFITECADPSLKPAIVEQFVQSVGSTNPLAITVKSGDRLILVPKPKTPEQAMTIIRDNIAGAVVRVGLTQFPAGVGLKDTSELKSDLVEPCANLRMGTIMFSKILQIVARWYGNPTNDEVFPQIFDDAIYAWRTGEFEGVSVFSAPHPSGDIISQPFGMKKEPDIRGIPTSAVPDSQAAHSADIRINLTRLGEAR